MSDIDKKNHSKEQALALALAVDAYNRFQLAEFPELGEALRMMGEHIINDDDPARLIETLKGFQKFGQSGFLRATRSDMVYELGSHLLDAVIGQRGNGIHNIIQMISSQYDYDPEKDENDQIDMVMYRRVYQTLEKIGSTGTATDEDILRYVHEKHISEHAPEFTGMGWIYLWDMPDDLFGMTRAAYDLRIEILIGDGLLDGCPCGCRGDYHLTNEGMELIGVEPVEECTGCKIGGSY
jgi:hypothetical protein